jgi:hypothetical protein
MPKRPNLANLKPDPGISLSFLRPLARGNIPSPIPRGSIPWVRACRASPALPFSVLKLWQFSRKLGCEVCTNDTHPKRDRLGSNSMALHRREPALRRPGLVDSSGGRSLPRLQAMYRLPSHQLRRRRPHHSLLPRSVVCPPHKDCLLLAERREAFAFLRSLVESSLFTRFKAKLMRRGFVAIAGDMANERLRRHQCAILDLKAGGP